MRRRMAPVQAARPAVFNPRNAQRHLHSVKARGGARGLYGLFGVFVVVVVVLGGGGGGWGIVPKV